MAHNVDLKLVFAPEDLGKVAALPPLAQAWARREPQHLAETYFDTAEGDLRESGFSLSLAFNKGEVVQTVRQEAAFDAGRGAWERKIDQFSPDFEALQATPLAAVLEKDRVRHSLRPAFEMKIQRLEVGWAAEKAKITAILDQSLIKAGNEALLFCDLALALEAGEPRAPFDLARRLSASLPLRLSLISDAERGHLFAQGLWGCPRKGAKPSLPAGSTCRQGFQAIARPCVHDFIVNLEALEPHSIKLSRSDREEYVQAFELEAIASRENGSIRAQTPAETSNGVEAVHQGRISIRHLRAALSLFKPIILDEDYGHLRMELKWLGKLLGAARDLDVFTERLKPSEKEEDQPPREAAPLVARFAERRRSAYEKVFAGVRTQRARDLLIDLFEWIEIGGWTKKGQALDEPMATLAYARLKKLRKKLVRQGADLEDLSAAARHKVRIKAKKLRYMAEFAVNTPGVAPRKPLKRLIRALNDLQNTLGELRDQEAAADFVKAEAQRWREEEKGADETAISALDEWLAARASKGGLDEALDAYADLARANPF